MRSGISRMLRCKELAANESTVNGQLGQLCTANVLPSQDTWALACSQLVLAQRW